MASDDPKWPSASDSPRQPGRIIAVGGAKGGVGKSAFCANLGVFLASLGKRTVMVDLDLGASNLHLFFGIWSLDRKIDDFLNKRVPAFEEIFTKTSYGPWLAGGGGGGLGSANIPFARKIKLLKTLKSIAADYVIIDLGGDTTFNMLDFFLAADRRLVLTTCDPASYLDAYNFIKMALYRKLTRLFGPESDLHQSSDPALISRILDFVHAGSSGAALKIDQLLEQIKVNHPQQHGWVQDQIRKFRPLIVINMPAETADAALLAERLQKVSRRMLSVELTYLGSIPFEKEIQQCALDLVPHVARQPNGTLADFFRRILPEL
jgi:flagellar biosynthesis protein FlhG